MKRKVKTLQTIKCDKCGNTAKTTEPNHEAVFANLGFTSNPAKKLKDLCKECSSNKAK